jgi:prepilin-type processing-associated H-X9-DG protein
MYAKDNDEKAPLLIEPWDWNTDKNNPKYSGRFLHTALGDYVKTDQIFFCPAWEAIERDGTRSGSNWYDKYTWGPIGYSHAPNWPDSGYTNGTFADPKLLDSGRNTYVRSLSQAKYPDRLIILLCNTPNDHSGYIDSEVSNQYKNLILGSNFMYADGHVKFIRFYAKDWSDGNRRGTAFYTLWWMGGLPPGEAY